MRMILAAAGFLLLAPFAASAGTVTYNLRGFIEHYPNGGASKPAGYGHVEPIVIVLNTSAPATVSGNSATYGGKTFGTNDPADPIVSIKVGSATQVGGGFDTVQITQNPGGPSSITIQHYVPQLGACTFSFVAARGTGSAPLAIPAKIYTLQYDTSTFSYAFNGSPALYVAGDMTSLAVPP